MKWLKNEPVLLVKVNRETKENLSRFTIHLDWKGVLKLLVHRKIIVVVAHYPITMKGKMKATPNRDGTYTFNVEAESGGQDG